MAFVTTLDIVSRLLSCKYGQAFTSYVVPRSVDVSGAEPDWLFSSPNSSSSAVSIEFIFYHKFKPGGSTELLNPWVGQDVIGTSVLQRSMDVPTSWFAARDSASLRKKVDKLVGNDVMVPWPMEPVMEVGYQMVMSQPPRRPLSMAVFLTKITLLPPEIFHILASLPGPEHVSTLDLRIIWGESLMSKDAATRNSMLQMLQQRISAVTHLGGYSLKSKLVYRSRGGSEEDPIICPICLDEINVCSHIASNPCCHNFHGNCLRSWRIKKNICPLCSSPCTFPLYFTHAS